MFERFTERARRCIFFARQSASEYGSPIIETEHFLLGILHARPEAMALSALENSPALSGNETQLYVAANLDCALQSSWVGTKLGTTKKAGFRVRP